MSTSFTASNGLVVGPHRARPELGYAIYDGDDNTLDNAYSHLNSVEMEALRQFFRHEEDERLGRWRWPENPDYVVYPDGRDSVLVLDEVDADFQRLSRADAAGTGPSGIYREAARAHFAAHPEPKPWYAAKPGEVWELHWLARGREAWFVNSAGSFIHTGTGAHRRLTDPSIRGGGRIWPRDSTS